MMELIKKHFSIIFLAIGLSDIWQICSGESLRYLTKPLIMLSLIAYYLMATKRPNLGFVVALVMAWLGDMFLLFDGKTFFMLGLGSFLVMQILYAIIFLRNSYELTLGKAIFATVIIVPCLLLVYRLLGFAEGFEIPIIAYAFSIIAMLKSAVFRKTNEPNYNLLLTGSICFLMSDMVLAHRIFDTTISEAMISQFAVIVISLYSLGQYLIVITMAEIIDK